MKDLPHVTWLRAFEAAARHSSFAIAAAELGLTSAAVSQQIRHLEKHLDTQLFRRLPRGVQLTENGVAYSQVVRKSFEDMAIATSGLFGKDASGWCGCARRFPLPRWSSPPALASSKRSTPTFRCR